MLVATPSKGIASMPSRRRPSVPQTRHALCALALLVGLVLALPASAGADVFGELGEPATIETEPTTVVTGPSVTSDKADYAPGAEVTLTGSGWQPGESVRVVVDDDGIAEVRFQHDAIVEADAEGNFVNRFDLPPWLV